MGENVSSFLRADSGAKEKSQSNGLNEEEKCVGNKTKI